jgi:hypothetical protein
MKQPEIKLTPNQIHIIHAALSRHLKKHHYDIVEDVAQIKDQLRRYEIELQEEHITEQVLKKEEAKKQAEESKKKGPEVIPLKSDKKGDEPKGVSDGPPNKPAAKKASGS